MAPSSTNISAHIRSLRTENNGTPMLNTPIEIRRLLLDAIFDDLPRNSRGLLDISKKGWIPPPILQVCHELRRDGVCEFAKLPAVRVVREFNGWSFINSERWNEMIETYYGVTLQFDIDFHVETCYDSRVGKRNLTAWVQTWFVTKRGGLMLDCDVEDYRELRDAVMTVFKGPYKGDTRADDLTRLFLKAYQLRRKGTSWEDAYKQLAPTIEWYCDS